MSIWSSSGMLLAPSVQKKKVVIEKDLLLGFHVLVCVRHWVETESRQFEKVKDNKWFVMRLRHQGAKVEIKTGGFQDLFKEQ